jgi:hypothetical protein
LLGSFGVLTKVISYDGTVVRGEVLYLLREITAVVEDAGLVGGMVGWVVERR